MNWTYTEYLQQPQSVIELIKILKDEEAEEAIRISKKNGNNN